MDHVDKSLEYLGKAVDRLEAEMIDPKEFGSLTAQVGMLERQVSDLQDDMKTLLELANRSRGGLWVGMAIASMLGGVVAWIAAHFQVAVK